MVTPLYVSYDIGLWHSHNRYETMIINDYDDVYYTTNANFPTTVLSIQLLLVYCATAVNLYQPAVNVD